MDPDQYQGMHGSAAIGIVPAIFGLAVLLVIIAGLWKVFEKAGKPGWAAIVPVYNTIVLLEIVGKPIWWIVLLFIPCVSIVIAVILALELAKAFGKSAAFGVGIILLGFVFIPILGFGDAKYVGPKPLV